MKMYSTHFQIYNLDSRGYFLAMKRATKERVAKRREKPLVQAVNPSEHAAQSRCAFHFQSQLLSLEISLVDRQTVFIRIAIG